MVELFVRVVLTAEHCEAPFRHQLADGPLGLASARYRQTHKGYRRTGRPGGRG
jgi:hypothetical protein